MITLQVTLEIKDALTTEEARAKPDAFREAVQPTQEYGITIYETAPSPETPEGDPSEPGHPNNPRADYDVD